MSGRRRSPRRRSSRRRLPIGPDLRAPKVARFEQVYPTVPRSLILIPTFRCPLRCSHCELGKLAGREMDRGMWRRRILELAEVAERPFLVGISGGEPLLYDGILDIIRACRQAGFFTAMATSTRTLNERMVAKLISSGLTSLVVSLDGLGPAHDRFRRSRGLFDQALKTIAAVRKVDSQMDISVVTTVARDTLPYLGQMVRWVQDNELVTNICFHTLSGNLGSEMEFDPRWWEQSPLWPGGMPELSEALDELEAMAQLDFPLVNSAEEIRAMRRFYAAPDDVQRPCDQNRFGMMVLPDGSVKICSIRDVVGTVSTHTMVEVWNSLAARQLRQRMAVCRRNCHLMNNYAYQRHDLRTIIPPGSLP